MVFKIVLYFIPIFIWKRFSKLNNLVTENCRNGTCLTLILPLEVHISYRTPCLYIACLIHYGRAISHSLNIEALKQNLKYKHIANEKKLRIHLVCL
jgi:hypothetical protein